MTNKEFDDLIKQAITEHFDEYFLESEIDYTPHEFSPEFEKRMNKLIGSMGKIKHISRKKLITCIIAAIIAACAASMSVSAIREAFINFIMNVFDTHTDVQSVYDDAPLDFSEKYEVTADMSDFELMSIKEYISHIEYTYENEHCTLYFRQYIKEYYDIAVNTEGYEMETINVNDREGFYINMYRHNAKCITWDNGDYVFSIVTSYNNEYNLDKQMMLSPPILMRTSFAAM